MAVDSLFPNLVTKWKPFIELFIEQDEIHPDAIGWGRSACALVPVVAGLAERFCDYGKSQTLLDYLRFLGFILPSLERERVCQVFAPVARMVRFASPHDAPEYRGANAWEVLFEKLWQSSRDDLAEFFILAGESLSERNERLDDLRLLYELKKGRWFERADRPVMPGRRAVGSNVLVECLGQPPEAADARSVRTDDRQKAIAPRARFAGALLPPVAPPRSHRAAASSDRQATWLDLAGVYYGLGRVSDGATTVRRWHPDNTVMALAAYITADGFEPDAVQRRTEELSSRKFLKPLRKHLERERLKKSERKDLMRQLAANLEQFNVPTEAAESAARQFCKKLFGLRAYWGFF
jgi:hypothetical protein